MDRVGDLPKEIEEDLLEAERLARVGSDTVARNLASYLRYDVLPTLRGECGEVLRQRLDKLEEQLRLPRSKRFRPQDQGTRPPRRGTTFTCVFCHQKWWWDVAQRAKNGWACTACAKSVMCPKCRARKSDAFPVCFGCSGVRSVKAPPHGFHL